VAVVVLPVVEILELVSDVEVAVVVDPVCVVVDTVVPVVVEPECVVVLLVCVVVVVDGIVVVAVEVVLVDLSLGVPAMVLRPCEMRKDGMPTFSWHAPVSWSHSNEEHSSKSSHRWQQC